MGNRFDKPYDQRTDSDKVAANWIKTRVLFDREDWSMAIVRAAITLELSADLAVRQILAGQHNPTRITKILKDLNGFYNKFTQHIIPNAVGTAREQETRDMLERATTVSRKRNDICHGGIFLNEVEATTLLATAHGVIVPFVRRYEPDFTLEELTKSKGLRTKRRRRDTDESNEDQVDEATAAVNRDRRY